MCWLDRLIASRTREFALASLLHDLARSPLRRLGGSALAKFRHESFTATHRYIGLAAKMQAARENVYVPEFQAKKGLKLWKDLGRLRVHWYAKKLTQVFIA